MVNVNTAEYVQSELSQGFDITMTYARLLGLALGLMNDEQRKKMNAYLEEGF